MNAPISSRNPWPAAIIGFFSVLITCIVAFTVFASRQQMELVRPDYYDEEIRFQQHLDRLNRTRPLNAQVSITYDGEENRITINLPAPHASGAAVPAAAAGVSPANTSPGGASARLETRVVGGTTKAVQPAPRPITGNIHLYRPSDAKLDRNIPLAVNGDGIQKVGTEDLRSGLWKIRVSWEVNEQEYFFDQSIVVMPRQSNSSTGWTQTRAPR